MGLVNLPIAQRSALQPAPPLPAATSHDYGLIRVTRERFRIGNLPVYGWRSSFTVGFKPRLRPIPGEAQLETGMGPLVPPGSAEAKAPGDEENGLMQWGLLAGVAFVAWLLLRR